MNMEEIMRVLAVNQSLLNMILMKLGFTEKEVIDMTTRLYEVYDNNRKG